MAIAPEESVVVSLVIVQIPPTPIGIAEVASVDAKYELHGYPTSLYVASA